MFRKKSHPRSRYFKMELSKRLRLVVSTFPEVKTKNQLCRTSIRSVQEPHDKPVTNNNL
jgi:hypothetical protein